MGFTDMLARRGGAARMRGQVMAIVVALLTTAMVVVVGSPPAHAGSGATNGKLAFSAIDSATGSDIWVMDSDGSNPENLTASWLTTDNFPSWEVNPVWSPDGTEIVLVSGRGHAAYTNHSIWVMGADGSNPREVFRGGRFDSASWSPDGEWILFAQWPVDATDNGWLYRIRPDGTDLTLVLQAEPDEQGFQSPRWAPDGSLIAFLALGASSQSRLFIVKPDGSDRMVLAPTSDAIRHPRWSPDSSTIAYSDRPEVLIPRDVRAMARDGSGVVSVVPDAENPVWSPDGTTVLYSRRIDFVWHLYSRPVGGGPETAIPIPFIDSVTVFAPNWDWQPVPVAGDPVVGLVDPGQGLWRLYDDAGVLTTSFFFGNPGDFPIVGDWDCDGVETPGMYRQSDGFVYLRNSNTQGVADVKFFFGNPGDVPIAGDFNNDGCGTVSIYRPSNQTFYIINKLGENNGGLGAAEFSYVFGSPGDGPFVGDFDGDGIETVGLHRESTGLVYFRNSHTQGNADAQFIFGNPGDRIVAGDWNADSVFSPALFRPSSATMYFRYTNTQGNADNQFVPNPNGSTWLPVAGEFK